MKKEAIIKTTCAGTATAAALVGGYAMLWKWFVAVGWMKMIEEKILENIGEEKISITLPELKSFLEPANEKAGVITGVAACAVAAVGYFYQEDIIELLGWND